MNSTYTSISLASWVLPNMRARSRFLTVFQIPIPLQGGLLHAENAVACVAALNFNFQCSLLCNESGCADAFSYQDGHQGQYCMPIVRSDVHDSRAVHALSFLLSDASVP